MMMMMRSLLVSIVAVAVGVVAPNHIVSGVSDTFSIESHPPFLECTFDLCQQHAESHVHRLVSNKSCHGAVMMMMMQQFHSNSDSFAGCAMPFSMRFVRNPIPVDSPSRPSRHVCTSLGPVDAFFV